MIHGQRRRLSVTNKNSGEKRDSGSCSGKEMLIKASEQMFQLKGEIVSLACTSARPVFCFISYF